MDQEEEIVMTPSKKGKTTCIRIEKKRKMHIDDSQVAHKGGGQNSGLVIQKQNAADNDLMQPQDLRLEFKCYLVDGKTGKHIPESRALKFWFAEETEYLDKVTGAYEFFKELVQPDSFPRDYVGFIKKIMTQCRDPKYYHIKKVECDLCQLEADDAGMQQAQKEDTRPKEIIMQDQVLHTLESAYPNILPMEDLLRFTDGDMSMVQEQLQILKGRNLIKELEPGKWVRKVLDEKNEVKIVKNISSQVNAQKPTIAVITSKYYEKLAVDAMMENKTTYVRFKTEGESNVYTIGEIGRHKVVSTKIPQLGRQRAAQISSGNTTTRLLGTFSDVEHVLLVGVAGGVPHYTDYFKHNRLGDVIFATPNDRGYMYIYCDRITHDSDKGTVQYALKSWSPHNAQLQQVFQTIQDEIETQNGFRSWEHYINEGQSLLSSQEVDFCRPPSDTDKLFMNIGGSDIIEVGHPPVPDHLKPAHREGNPVLRVGALGSGKPVVQDDALRQDFSVRHNIVGFDMEYDQVLESIVGNRKDSFAFIRGVSDYLDGTKNDEWTPYAALSAAAFMKTLIEALPLPNYS